MYTKGFLMGQTRRRKGEKTLSKWVSECDYHSKHVWRDSFWRRIVVHAPALSILRWTGQLTTLRSCHDSLSLSSSLYPSRITCSTTQSTCSCWKAHRCVCVCVCVYVHVYTHIQIQHTDAYFKLHVHIKRVVERDEGKNHVFSSYSSSSSSSPSSS